MKQNFQKAPFGQYDKTCSMKPLEAHSYLDCLMQRTLGKLSISHKHDQTYIHRFDIQGTDLYKITYTFKSDGLMVLDFSETQAFKNEGRE